MNKNILAVDNNDTKFMNAFIKVANILEPNVEFTNVLYSKNIKKDGTEVDICVSGIKFFCDVKCMVEVTKEIDCYGLEGEQIVVRYISFESGETLQERKVWFYTFNWTGLKSLA